jgi:hypothetical protein
MEIVTKELREKIVRGARLAREIKSLEAKKEELDLLKAEFRELANGDDLELVTPRGAKVTVSQKGAGIARVVEVKKIPRVIKLAGSHIFNLFTLHPSKGDEKSFDLNAYKQLPKANALALIDTLTVDATPWVKFS